MRYFAIPQDIQACLIEFDGKKDKWSLPWGVIKRSKGYQPAIPYPNGNSLKVDEFFDDPLECHQHFQAIFIQFASDALQEWAKQEGFEHVVGVYILEEVVKKVLDDYEQGRESY